jgi:peptide-methionine (S)-S-oxide reductase
MPTKQLPPKPNLDHLRRQAKDLLQQHGLQERSCAQRLREFHPRLSGSSDDEIFSARLTLTDAQLAISREYGFASWSRLKSRVEDPKTGDDLTLPHHDRIDDPVFSGAVHLIDSGAVSALAHLLQERPNLIRERVHFEGGNYFRHPALLDFIAENPMRNGVLPGNIVQVAEVLLQAGPDQRSLNETLGLIASGCVARECKVQLPLIELLCSYGAEPNTALHTAILHGEFDAVRQLIQCGAKADLPVLAGLGETRGVLQHLSASDSAQRQLALELGAQYGHVDIVRALLDDGVDPNRYSTGHSHSTALHQAALAGHMDTVVLLVERGAKGDLRDTLWNGTAADWAAHAGHTTVADFLREHQRGQD